MTNFICKALISTAFALLSFGASAEPLKVVASFSIIGDFARHVGGNRIELTTLVGPGGDAHVYEPKPADLVAMRKAQVVLVNGLHFEGFLARLVETSGTTGEIAELTRGVETIALKPNAEHSEADDHHHADIDPHAFQSVANAQIYVRNVAQTLCTADPVNCDFYKTNALAYDSKLEALESELKAAVASIPPERRTVITSHDAFGYFEHAYGIRFLAPEGISTEAEASAADVAALVRQVRADKASAIFVENITDPRLMQQIARETGLKLGGTLYSDALSDGPPAATYIDMMRHNIETIKGAVNGS